MLFGWVELKSCFALECSKWIDARCLDVLLQCILLPSMWVEQKFSACNLQKLSKANISIRGSTVDIGMSMEVRVRVGVASSCPFSMRVVTDMITQGVIFRQWREVELNSVFGRIGVIRWCWHVGPVYIIYRYEADTRTSKSTLNGSSQTQVQLW